MDFGILDASIKSAELSVMPPAPFITLNEETMVIEAFDLTEDAIGTYELTLDVELDQSSADEE